MINSDTYQSVTPVTFFILLRVLQAGQRTAMRLLLVLLAGALLLAVATVSVVATFLKYIVCSI